MALRTFLVCSLFCLLAPGLALADAAPFDLAGPNLQVKVTHGAASLPISAVPNLSVGDQLSIRADLPPGQSAHYLLVAAFLRGATNPPPKSWFYRAETWSKKGRDGLKLTVPAGAQQILIFLAPQTGGDFDTLVDAVRGRPGAFVRASQDLNQAALDRSRLDMFLAVVRKQNPVDPDRLKAVASLLARGLSIKLNTDCFDKMPEQQAACLMQGQDTLVLNDGHSTSIVEALTTGNAADLAFQLSATPQANFGYYTPYIAAVADIARIMDSLHTAQYQYIPALARPVSDELALVLNTPPSFHNPLSVLVTALPAVEPPQAPPLQPVDPKAVYCAERAGLVLPVEGAPLVYSTRYAHDMFLRVNAKDGKTIDLPVKADVAMGGLTADTAGFDSAKLGEVIDGDLHGDWGFEHFDGPKFQLRNAHAAPWRLVADDQQALIVGRDDTLRLEGPEAACVDAVTVQQGSDEPRPVVWKVLQPDTLSVTVPMTNAQPGDITLLVKQYGVQAPDAVPLQAFSQAGRFDSFTLHAGDVSGVLKGSRLDEVAGLTFDGVDFKPGVLTSAGGGDELSLDAADPDGVGKLKVAQSGTAKVRLRDGRVTKLKVTVDSPRPRVVLIAKSILASGPKAPIAIQLAGSDEAPQSAQLTFSVRGQPPTHFSNNDKIEVASLDGAVSTTLTAAAGLTVEDPQVAVASLDPAKAFGPSAFGALRFRVVQDRGAGDWQPLVTLVRLPALEELKCQQGPGGPCDLSGANLFLIDAVSNNASFEHAVQVPQGFPGHMLHVPSPVDGRLYVKLHDDPQVINQMVVSKTRHPSQNPSPSQSGSPSQNASPSQSGSPSQNGAPSPNTTGAS